jgi:pimeloyl-ACP methyl ester carboxylesterase
VRRVGALRGTARWLARCASAALMACGALHAQPTAEPTWERATLSGSAGADLFVLRREPLALPLRFRVIVVPGSGCASLAEVAPRYFAGLLHAQVLVLHKPGIDSGAGLSPPKCSDAFVRTDRLSTWRDHAVAALRAETQARAAQGLPIVPTVLVGISEGAEILSALAPEVPQLAGLVLLSASGLDPLEAGTLQAQRLGVLAVWEALGSAQASTLPDATVVQGRSLGYWRDLWRWPVATPLLSGTWPLLQIRGERDALVPSEAYARFAARAQGRPAAFCTKVLAGADHGLQSSDRDGVQGLWAWLEQWARAPREGLCAPLQR